MGCSHSGGFSTISSERPIHVVEGNAKITKGMCLNCGDLVPLICYYYNEWHKITRKEFLNSLDGRPPHQLTIEARSMRNRM